MRNNSSILLTTTILILVAQSNSFQQTLITTNSTETTDDTDLCDEFFLNLTQYRPGSDVPPDVQNLLLYSGHNLNDLGFYNECASLPTQKYLLVTIVATFPGSIGFCGPSYCSATQLQNNAAAAIGILTQLNISSYGSVVFTDPSQFEITNGFPFYFTVGILSVLVAALVAGTLVGFFRRREMNKPQDPVDPNDSVMRDPLVLNESSDSLAHNLLSTDDQHKSPPAEPSLPLRLLECFDLGANIEALFKDEKVQGHDQNLNITAGLRSLAFGWVVYGHTFLASKYTKNFMFEQVFYQTAWLLIVAAAMYAVDVFFYLSGFLAGFLLISKLRKMPFGLKSYVLIMFHRWIRIWPAYFVAIMFYWKISVHIGSGPLWFSYLQMVDSCGDGGAIKNFFFLDNVLNTNSSYCYSWGWYLACDFQMFLLTPFICWIYLKNRDRYKTIMWSLLFISTIASFAYAANTGYTFFLNPGTETGDDYMNMYYMDPLVRMSPYIVGLWLGILFREYKEGKRNFYSIVKESTIKSLLCFTLGTLLLLFLVFYPRVLQTGTVWPDGFAMTWSTLNRPLFVTALFLMTGPCLVGNLSTVSNFLQNYYFIVIARLSYTSYLVHLALLEMMFTNTTTMYGGSELYTSCLALGLALFALGVGAILHLLVEKPFTNMEAQIMSQEKKTKVVLTKNVEKRRSSVAL